MLSVKIFGTEESKWFLKSSKMSRSLNLRCLLNLWKLGRKIKFQPIINPELIRGASHPFSNNKLKVKKNNLISKKDKKELEALEKLCQAGTDQEKLSNYYSGYFNGREAKIGSLNSAQLTAWTKEINDLKITILLP